MSTVGWLGPHQTAKGETILKLTLDKAVQKLTPEDGFGTFYCRKTAKNIGFIVSGLMPNDYEFSFEKLFGKEKQELFPAKTAMEEAGLA